MQMSLYSAGFEGSPPLAAAPESGFAQRHSHLHGHVVQNSCEVVLSDLIPVWRVHVCVEMSDIFGIRTLYVPRTVELCLDQIQGIDLFPGHRNFPGRHQSAENIVAPVLPVVPPLPPE